MEFLIFLRVIRFDSDSIGRVHLRIDSFHFLFTIIQETWVPSWQDSSYSYSYSYALSSSPSWSKKVDVDVDGVDVDGVHVTTMLLLDTTSTCIHYCHPYCQK